MDVAFGTLFSNLAMYFIILTTTLTLHGNGITNIETSAGIVDVGDDTHYKLDQGLVVTAMHN